MLLMAVRLDGRDIGMRCKVSDRRRYILRNYAMSVSASITKMLCTPLVLFMGTSVSGQSDVVNHESTLQPIDARFELVQSPLAAKWTFRLDRYTGRVDRLVRSFLGDLTWEEMPVIGLSEEPDAKQPRFVLFTSGLAARHTFLMDSTTGKTWVLTTLPSTEDDPEETPAWSPLLE